MSWPQPSRVFIQGYGNTIARQIVVEIVGDDRKFTGTLSDAVVKTETLTGRLKNVGKGVAIGAGVAGFNLLMSAIDLGISKLDEMHQAFLDDEASQARLQNVLKNSVANYDEASKAAEEFAGAQADLGFQDDDVRDGLAQLVGVTHDLTEAQKLYSLAQDIARAKNIDIATAVDAVNKAYNGQGRALAAIGIDVAGITDRTQLLARAYQNVNGAAAAYAKTGNGMVDRANVKMAETMEKVGGAIDKVSQVVIPIMVAGLGGIVDFLGEAIQAATEFANNLTTVLGPALSAIGDLASRVAQAIAFVVAAAQGLGGAAGALTGVGGGAQGAGAAAVNAGSTGGVTVTTIPGHFLHQGGIVPGVPGSDVPAILQAGERVIPAGSAAPVININIASFIGSDRDIDRFSDRLAFRLRATALS